MTKQVLLNNVEHKELRVLTHYSAEFGDNLSKVLTFPTEYGDVQREYPILFEKKEETGEYQSIALLGFEKGENLFLSEGEWNASYVPGIVARGPFLIGFQQQEADGDVRKETVIHVDMDNPRVSFSDGEPVFLRHGGNTPYLERVANILKGIHEGVAASKQMFAAFESLGLIEPVAVEIQLNEDERYSMNGYYTINEEKLAALDGGALEKLNKAGFLQGAFLVIASWNNMKKLIDMKNRALVRDRPATA